MLLQIFIKRELKHPSHAIYRNWASVTSRTRAPKSANVAKNATIAFFRVPVRDVSECEYLQLSHHSVAHDISYKVISFLAWKYLWGSESAFENCRKRACCKNETNHIACARAGWNMQQSYHLRKSALTYYSRISEFIAHLRAVSSEISRRDMKPVRYLYMKY